MSSKNMKILFDFKLASLGCWNELPFFENVVDIDLEFPEHDFLGKSLIMLSVYNFSL